jgi:indolepyruvate ferredoxin oxidoreductase beta subunit
MPSPTSSSHMDFPRNRPFNIIVAGVGGQGILRAARLVSGAAHSQGLAVTIGETFGASRRGGTVISHIRLSPTQPVNTNISTSILHGSLIPRYMADVIIGLEPLETLRAAKYLNPKTRVLFNTHQQLPIDVLAGKVSALPISTIETRLTSVCSHIRKVKAVELAQQAGDTRTANTVMIGVLAGLNITPINQDSFANAINTQFIDSSIRSINEKAYKLGVQYGNSL